MKTLALIVGHSPDSPGAVGHDGTTEFAFNNELARRIAHVSCGVKVVIVYRGRPNDLSGLPAKVNALKPDFIISLHANAFNKKASGTETLYWHSSKNGKRLAEILQKHLVFALGLPNRGIKPKKPGDRGAIVLEKTNAPAVIAEPFFIDSPSDLATARAKMGGLIAAYVAAITEYAT